MRWFIAGAIAIGAVVARHSVLTRSSASPCASFASVLAVAGAITHLLGPARKFDVSHRRFGGLVPERAAHGPTGDGLEARRADEVQRIRGHRHLHVGTGVAQATHQFDRLVRSDATADA